VEPHEWRAEFEEWFSIVMTVAKEQTSVNLAIVPHSFPFSQAFQLGIDPVTAFQLAYAMILMNAIGGVN
jgi:hypothetical protein